MRRRLNLGFNLVSADGNIYCYEFTNSLGHAFIQLVSATQLKIEFFASGGTCGSPGTWSFSGNAVTFAR